MNEKILLKKTADKLERKLAAANETRRMIPAGMTPAGGDPICGNTRKLLTRIFLLVTRTFFLFFVRRKMAIRVTRYRNESRDPPDDPHVTSEREFSGTAHFVFFEFNLKRK
jgi:hypothetical protein